MKPREPTWLDIEAANAAVHALGEILQAETLEEAQSIARRSVFRLGLKALAEMMMVSRDGIA